MPQQKVNNSSSTPARVRGRYAVLREEPDVTRRRVGEPRARGRLLVPAGPIGLRSGLSGFGRIDLAAAFALVSDEWDVQVAAGTVSGQIIAMYKGQCRALVGYATVMGVHELGDVRPNLVVQWVHTPRADGDPVALNTRLSRRSAVRALFLTAMRLGLTDENPADAVMETKRSARYVHQLTDAQVHHLQLCAPHRLSETKTPVALALMLLGAGTREAGHVEVRDIDLVERRVWLHHGGERYRDRWVPIDVDWCRLAIWNRLTALDASSAAEDEFASTALVYEARRAETTPLLRQAAVSRTIIELMKRARIYEAGVTRPESIREWVAARVFDETGSVEAVAERLGMFSLDGAAHIVGYDWVNQWAIDAAAPAGRSRRRSR